jgi:hypothetical protein
VEQLLGVQKDYAMRLNGASCEIQVEEQKQSVEVPDLSEDVEDLKKVDCKNSASTSSESS